MTTLTANTPRLPEHCEHKLPTSCRLTARPVCCACQDNRPHAASYSKYIDGVGFVPWGTRQERYCWPCKEFWDVRISISGMRTADTRLPESPDLTRFLDEWYDWHRGYRVSNLENGTEDHQPLVGESLSSCTHGYLPRSADEIQQGLQPGEREYLERGSQPPAAPARRQQEDDFVVPEDERLFDEDDAEGREQQSQDSLAGANGNITEEPNSPETETERIARIRRIAAAEHGHLAELAGDNPFTPTSQNERASTQSRVPEDVDLAQPIRVAREHYQRVTALRRELQRMRVGIERVMSGLQTLQIDVPDSSEAVDHLNRLSGSLSRYREAPLEIPELLNPDYQSPITGMFERAWRWHQQVQSDRLQAISAQDPAPPLFSDLANAVGPGGSQTDPLAPPPPPHEGTSQVPYAQLMADWRASRQQRMDRLPPRRPRLIQVRSVENDEDSDPNVGLDRPGRPPAIENDEHFKVDTRCEVCLQQVANVATFPCGHMIMCQWCADEVVPRHISARNIPRDPTSKCPQCRRKVRHIYTVHVRHAKDYKGEENVGEEGKTPEVEENEQ